MNLVLVLPEATGVQGQTQGSLANLGGIYMRPGRTQTGMKFLQLFNRDEMLGAWFRDKMTCFVK